MYTILLYYLIKNMLSSQKMCNNLKRIFRFFFVRSIVFEVWSILYSTVNSRSAMACELEIFANLIQKP